MDERLSEHRVILLSRDEALVTCAQLTRIDALVHAIGLPADGSGMRAAQERVGGSGHAYGYRLMTRGQADQLLKLLRVYRETHRPAREVVA